MRQPTANDPDYAAAMQQPRSNMPGYGAPGYGPPAAMSTWQQPAAPMAKKGCCGCLSVMALTAAALGAALIAVAHP